MKKVLFSVLLALTLTACAADQQCHTKGEQCSKCCVEKEGK